jgi:hypothetical protein
LRQPEDVLQHVPERRQLRYGDDKKLAHRRDKSTKPDTLSNRRAEPKF